MTEQERNKEMEKEANAFALALLMPKDRFLKELRAKDIDVSDENCNRLQEIATMFGVSLNAVVARIAMLK